MRIATWNVNSIRTRADRVLAWLDRTDTDVLAIQETKCRDDQFPHLLFEAAGYEVAHTGINQWNGVAIVSRVGIDDVETAFPSQPAFGRGEPVVEPRALGASVGRAAPGADAPGSAGVRVWSVYVPNGRAVGDPHYDYKLAWLSALAEAAREWAQGPAVLLGDWNVAPLDEDVWDIEVFAGATHVSEPERAALAQIEAAGYEEVSRRFTPGEYTYWDYQRLAFPRNNGMRIDLAFASPAAAERVRRVWIDRDERKGKGASDHVPVVIDLEPAARG